MSGDSTARANTAEDFKKYYGISTEEGGRLDLESLYSPDEHDIEGGEDRWFLEKSIPNIKNNTTNAEATEAMLQGGSSYGTMISNPNVNGDKTYSTEEAMGEVDTSKVDLKTETSSGQSKAAMGIGIAGGALSAILAPFTMGGSLAIGAIGGLASGITGGTTGKTQENEQKRYMHDVGKLKSLAKEQFRGDIKSGKNTSYYIDENDKIRALKSQVNLTGYDGGVFAKTRSGIG